MDKRAYLTQIPSVDAMLAEPLVKELLEQFPREIVVEGIRKVLNARRSQILESLDPTRLPQIDKSQLIAELEVVVKSQMEPHLKYLINATGVILHTNLGRAPLSERVCQRITEIARQYSNLELDLSTGERGERYTHIEGLLRRLTGAESGLVVNNNAAAVLLVLNTFAQGKEVIVSRGQLIEIGGSFRIPDIMVKSGAILKEVGTTNKTHLRDYREAITPNTAFLLKVHTSNYRILGFTSEVSLEELVQLGREYHVPVMEDLGSGSLIDLSRYGLEKEPTVQDCIRAGVDIVTFSGDKLLGGPQAGLIVGKATYIEKLKKNPWTRAIRVDKMTLAGLEAVLLEYLDPEKAIQEIPTLRMLTMKLPELEARAKNLLNLLLETQHFPTNPDTPGQPSGESFSARILDDFSQVGGGALPLQKLPTKVVAVKPFKFSVQCLEERLRAYNPPILARIQNDELLLDPRTLEVSQFPILAEAISVICKSL
ncbi:MAG TPA: L-seryl-tRNA(Sec) selenium transferase [Candidatus Limnocylindrales bacterium]|nr:L-seryl-tRNA(Sec) selenium transferase [Candidatus Limnocylindrales bacterium]